MGYLPQLPHITHGYIMTYSNLSLCERVTYTLLLLAIPVPDLP